MPENVSLNAGKNPFIPTPPLDGQAVAGGSADGKVKDKTAEVVREVVSLIQKTITVTTATKSQSLERIGASGTTGAPVLDDPDNIDAKLADLEKLVAFLQLENDQYQSELAQQRIKNQQGVMDKRHTERLNKIDESIKAAKKAEAAAKAQRALGWLGAIFAVVTAIVLTVATGGLAAGRNASRRPVNGIGIGLAA